MAQVEFTDAAKADLQKIHAEDPEVVREALRIAKELDGNPYAGDRLREKSNLKPLAEAECRKIRLDRADRRETLKPRYRYRLVYRIEPHEGSPEMIVVMSVGEKDRAYRDATTRSAERLRDQALRPRRRS